MDLLKVLPNWATGARLNSVPVLKDFACFGAKLRRVRMEGDTAGAHDRQGTIGTLRL